MKVAVFGCLHGQLNNMYKAVEETEKKQNINIDFVLVCGDCQTIRHYDDLRCLAVPHKYKQIGDFHEYYSGAKKVPKLTVFVGGNHEASNYLMTMPFGGWVCDRMYYLGYAGVINYKGLRIAGVSGIFKGYNCSRGRFESMPLDADSVRSIYHTRCLDIFRLQILTRRAQKDNPIDVFLSHDWPVRIYDHGNKEQLLRFKPFFRSDINSRDGLGNPLTRPLVEGLKPRRWYAAHLHCKFYAKVIHNPDDGRCTEFLSLNKIENRGNFMEIVDIQPTREFDDSDVDLYYDEEWLTILRKTISLESDSKERVFCPKIEDDSAKKYLPTDSDIKETVDMMTSTGGLKIVPNFKMSEPVIYDRPDGSQPSRDTNRAIYFPNPQNEELCSRLRIRDINLIKSASYDKYEGKFGDTVESDKDDVVVRFEEDVKRPNQDAACFEEDLNPPAKRVAHARDDDEKSPGCA